VLDVHATIRLCKDLLDERSLALLHAFKQLHTRLRTPRRHHLGLLQLACTVRANQFTAFGAPP
jgi:hypothetical protein